MPTTPLQPDPSSEDSASRMVELEEKLMFSQRALEELSEVVLRQQGELEGLRREVESLRTLAERAIDLTSSVSPPDEKPPHY